MTELTISPAVHLHGCVRVPGDKSISHRALMLGSLAEGDTHVSGFLPSGDCLATLACLHTLGIGTAPNRSLMRSIRASSVKTTISTPCS